MANLSSIDITFLRDATDKEYLNLKRTNQDSLLEVLMPETFVDSYRTGSGVISNISIAVYPILGEKTAYEFAKYLALDYNSSRIMTISQFENLVSIEILDPWEIEMDSFSAGLVSVVETGRVPSGFEILSATLEPNVSPCDYVDVEITTSEQADAYFIGRAALILVSTNPFTVTLPRTSQLKITVVKDAINYNVSELVYGEPWFYFNKMYPTNIQVQVVTDILNGATVIFNVTYPTQQDQLPPNYDNLLYSLDGITYLAPGVNSVTMQSQGDYTVYVKDYWGCVVTKDYTVNQAAGREPYLFISDINSIGFSKSEEWNGNQDGIHKNSKNTLSGVEVGKFCYSQNDIFRDEDKVRIQFKSNYNDHIIHIEDCSGVDIAVPSIGVSKMSNNLDLFESLQCWIYNREGIYIGVYFTSGNAYDAGGSIIDTFTLDGNLPDSAIIGNSMYIYVEGVLDGIYTIQNIVYDSDINKRVIVLDFEFVLISPTEGFMRAYYDILPFEVYEFDVDFDVISSYFPTQSSDSDKSARVRLEVLDDVYGNEDYYTEYIDVLNLTQYNDARGLDKLVAINYYNDNNRSIFYLYGISHFIRAEVLEIENLIFDESESEKGDLTTYLAKSTVHEGVKISFAEVTERVKIKIVLALSSKYLFVNGVGYVKNDGFEVSKVENTNLYTITANLIESGKNFNINVDSKTGNTGSYKNIYIPKLITTNIGQNIKTS